MPKLAAGALQNPGPDPPAQAQLLATQPMLRLRRCLSPFRPRFPLIPPSPWYPRDTSIRRFRARRSLPRHPRSRATAGISPASTCRRMRNWRCWRRCCRCTRRSISPPRPILAAATTTRTPSTATPTPCHYALMLLHHQPRRVIEVGSGYSSGAASDIAEQTASDRPIDMTFIEPYPDELAALAWPGHLDGRLVQSGGAGRLPLSQFMGLEPATSCSSTPLTWPRRASTSTTCTSKCRPDSSVRRLRSCARHLLPVRVSGRVDQLQGAAGTRLTCSPAFLQHTDGFEIVLFNTFLQSFHEPWYAAKMPLCLKIAAAASGCAACEPGVS